MKYQLEIFVEGQRLDTFDYESLNIKKSTKDFKDISKVFTSFSRSITIPASKTNNKVFKHYSNTSISSGGFDGRSLKDAELKINGISLEKGKMALESVKKRNGEVYSYGIRFYGGLTELKKRIGEDYIHNLDLSSDDITNPNYRNLLSSSLISYPPICFILSSANRRFLYAKDNNDYISDSNLSGNGLVNIGYDSVNTVIGTSDEYGVVDNDLVGAYRVGSLIDAIESKYNLTMTGAVDFRYISEYRILLNSSNREIDSSTMNEYIDYTLTPSVFSFTTPNSYNVASNDTKSITTTSSFVKAQILTPLSTRLLTRHALRVCVQTTMTNFEVDVIRNGEVIGTISESNSQESNTNYTDGFRFYGGTDTVFRAKNYPAEAEYTFKARAAGNGSLTVSYRFANKSGLTNENATSYSSFTINATSSGDSFYNVSANLPKMKVKEFIGVLTKQFNLIPEVTINESGTHNIDFKHYDYYINQGESYDVTEYIDIDSEVIKPANLYSGIEFSYKEPKTAMQQAFRTVNNRNYGDLNYQISENEDRISGNSFEMNVDTNRVPVERLGDLTNPTSDDGLAWLQLTDLSNNRVDLGNCFFYALSAPSAQINYNTGSSNVNTVSPIVPSNLFYQNQTIKTVTDSQTGDTISSQFPAVCGNFFGAESDEIFLNNKNSGLGLVNLFWDNYLLMMFDSRSRKVKVSAYLPERVMIELNTNDKLSINDRLFIIESFSTNFSTGKTTLELIEVSSDIMSLFEVNDFDFSSLSGIIYHAGMNSSGEIVSEGSSTFSFLGNVKNRFIE